MPTSDEPSQPQRVARHPFELDVPIPIQRSLPDAMAAVRAEYRSCSRWMRLRCRYVTPIPNKSDEPLFVLDVGQSIELEWSWEGAIAFRPSDIERYAGDPDVLDQLTGRLMDEESGDKAAWEGEVVEVDEATGRIFVAVSDPQHPPRTGTFLIRPFEFLSFLDKLYQVAQGDRLDGLLEGRLRAALGGIHPSVGRPSSACLPELNQLWKHGWSILWGPPGTGKTYTLGRQVAAALADRSERILVVSTTNRATDEAAFSIGGAVRTVETASLASGEVLRLGKGASYREFAGRNLLELLQGTETEALHVIGQMQRRLDKLTDAEDRAQVRWKIRRLSREMRDAAAHHFSSPDVRVVITTAFRAVMSLSTEAMRRNVTEGFAPFTTILIDEAGLISRAATAALALLAARRVVVIGDSKQLAPISRISRVLPTNQAIWLAGSGLSHLECIEQSGPAVHLLKEQHRMHPEISRAVSHFQYGDVLTDAVTVTGRTAEVPALLTGERRAVWYVLDESAADSPSLRAERGPGNRSWIRRATEDVLETLFRDSGFAGAKGLFLSPFKAQARRISKFFSSHGIDGWTASTVHCQQGTEAEIVLFDTVNAGSYSWPYDEWKRLVNVGLSRARECVIVLASRDEMHEPYLQPLSRHLAPRVCGRSGRNLHWQEVPVERTFPVPPAIAGNPDLLSNQLAKRKILRPVMSAEQQRLCGFQMDGGPRLVRGVAGSGKTWVLAHWLQATVKQWHDRPDAKAWAVYANQSLKHLIADTLAAAWREENGAQVFPWDRVQLLHIREVLKQLLSEIGETLPQTDFDYDAAAGRFLKARGIDRVEPRCSAMFVDEAQDLGANTLKVLTALVQPNRPDDPKSRSVNIFYDNAQNIYRQRPPNWSEIGLDMRGRSTVMKESFRSTRPITEFALNVLYALAPPDADPDHKELVERGLIEETQRLGRRWWKVRFNQIDGPLPIVKLYPGYQQGFDALGKRVVEIVRNEGVQPRDITIIVHRDWAANKLLTSVRTAWREAGIEVTYEKQNPRTRRANTVIVCTSHSFKGYESEVVFVAGVEQFVHTTILSNNLYVAMTRARSLLHVFGWSRQSGLDQKLCSVLRECLECLTKDPTKVEEPSRLDDLEDLADRLGEEHRQWLSELLRAFPVRQEPLLADDGEIIAEPAFWLESRGRVWACFGRDEPGPHTRNRLSDSNIGLLMPGKVPE